MPRIVPLEVWSRGGHDFPTAPPCLSIWSILALTASACDLTRLPEYSICAVKEGYQFSKFPGALSRCAEFWRRLRAGRTVSLSEGCCHALAVHRKWGRAFGCGGRLHPCFHVVGEQVNFLNDCGASSLIGLKHQHVALNDIQAIFITHFHADHFGGIPFFMLDAQFLSKRSQPLTNANPTGLVRGYTQKRHGTY
jgi:Metallo-beta-lactamase superfamily